jgi:HAD superfamily hydrolase (TIGR01509 family)
MAIHPIPRPTDNPALDAVVWDYDGTLVASRAADEAAVAELLREEPAAAAGAEVFWAHEGEPILTRIDLAWPGAAERILPLFERQRPAQLFLGIRPILNTLRRQGMPMGVVSSRRRGPLEEGLQGAGLRGYFGVVIGLDDVASPKPDPEGLRRALDHLGARPQRAVFIGDSPLDIEAGRRAGVAAWRATWGAPHPVAASDDIVLGHPQEVAARLEAIRLRSAPVSPLPSRSRRR